MQHSAREGLLGLGRPVAEDDGDRVVLAMDPESGYRVRFVVTRVPPSAEKQKPHGIDHSLTLHQLLKHALSGLRCQMRRRVVRGADETVKLAG